MRLRRQVAAARTPNGNGGEAVNVDGSLAHGVNEANPDGEADNMTGYQDDVAECTMDGDDETACDSTYEETHDILFVAGVFDCTHTVSVTVKCEWDSDATTRAGTEFTAAEAVTGAECEVEVN